MKKIAMLLALLVFSAGAEALERWVTCAKEGETCRFDGLRRVSYGAGQKWMYRSFENAAACNSAAFGGDPAPNVRKSCRYVVVPDPIGYLPAAPHWAECAKENQVCRFDGKRKIAFGTGSTWVMETFLKDIECTTAVFGDPAPGKAKACRVLTSASGGTNTPLPQERTEQSPKWIGCALEGKFCGFDGRRRVAFGKGNRWNYAFYEGGVACTVAKFGDPAPGLVKECRFDLNSR